MRPVRPPVRRIPHILFLDEHDYDDFVDMEDIFDSDIDTGELMVAMPNNWTDLRLQDVNDGK